LVVGRSRTAAIIASIKQFVTVVHLLKAKPWCLERNRTGKSRRTG